MTSPQSVILPSPPSTDRAFTVIVFSVLGAHFALILWTIFFSSPSETLLKPPPSRKFLVQTVELTPPPPIAVAKPPQTAPLVAEALIKPVEKIIEPEPLPPVEEAEAKPLPPKPEPKKPEPKKIETPPKPSKPPVAPKKVEAKPAPPKAVVKPKPPEVKKVEKPAAKPVTPAKTAAPKDHSAEKLKQQELEKQKEAVQKAEKDRQRKLLVEAEERIAKIAAGHGKVDLGKSSTLTTAAVPSAITSLHIDALPAISGGVPLTFKEAAYRDELAGRLKLLLRLPEYGDVKVKLTLERSGKVAKVVIESSDSTANRKYIEKTLPGLNFPPFGTNFNSDAQYTFSITLSNE